MSKILIIGGSGYLGRHLSHKLSINHEVFITSRIKNKKTNSLVLDLEDSSSYVNVNFNTFNITFMLVSDMSGIQSKVINTSTLDLNCTAYKNLLNHLVKIKYSNHLVYISSMTVYSQINNNPVEESSNLYLPPNPYGLSKLFAEQLTKFYSRENKFKSVIIRIPGLFGGDRKSGFIYNAVDKISKNEDFNVSTENLKYWETISVLDASDMIEVLLNNYYWKEDCEVYNLSYGHETDIVDLAYLIKKILKSDSKISTTNPKGYKPFYLSNKKYLKLTDTYAKDFEKSLSSYIKSIV
jgi:nucleoside-diphosphate-sugar epimerase